MKQPHDNSGINIYISIVCYRWPVYTNIKFLVSDIHILGYENSKLTHHFINNHTKKVKCTPKIEKKSYGKTFTYTREKSYLIFKNLNLKKKFDKLNCYNKKSFD